ncbi:hypothetical protein C8J56DRAFT_894339 [Mycena floridula]|nr:hypothetical protein C8J56DRAFT_894339 [Mycena floridula]
MCVQGNLSLEQLYHRLKRMKPKIGETSPGQCLNELKLCYRKAGFRFQDAACWYFKCTNSEPHNCLEPFHGFLTLPIHVWEEIVDAGGDWGVYLMAEGEEEFDAKQEAGAGYLESIEISRTIMQPPASDAVEDGVPLRMLSLTSLEWLLKKKIKEFAGRVPQCLMPQDEEEEGHHEYIKLCYTGFGFGFLFELGLANAGRYYLMVGPSLLI